MLDLFSGADAPLTASRDPNRPRDRRELDVITLPVQKAILNVLSEVPFISSAMSCATKSRAREKRPGPLPLRSEKFPRGLLSAQSHH